MPRMNLLIITISLLCRQSFIWTSLSSTNPLSAKGKCFPLNLNENVNSEGECIEEATVGRYCFLTCLKGFLHLPGDQDGPMRSVEAVRCKPEGWTVQDTVLPQGEIKCGDYVHVQPGDGEEKDEGEEFEGGEEVEDGKGDEVDEDEDGEDEDGEDEDCEDEDCEDEDCEDENGENGDGEDEDGDGDKVDKDADGEVRVSEHQGPNHEEPIPHFSNVKFQDDCDPKSGQVCVASCGKNFTYMQNNTVLIFSDKETGTVYYSKSDFVFIRLTGDIECPEDDDTDEEGEGDEENKGKGLKVEDLFICTGLVIPEDVVVVKQSRYRENGLNGESFQDFDYYTLQCPDTVFQGFKTNTVDAFCHEGLWHAYSGGVFLKDVTGEDLRCREGGDGGNGNGDGGNED